MADGFQIIVITTPGEVADEARMIEAMLKSGSIDRVHIRKPDWTDNRVEALIRAIPSDLHERLSMHGHTALRSIFPQIGIHLRGDEGVSSTIGSSVSKSCHSISELEKYAGLTGYMTLSPIYDSISKTGYASAFKPTELANVLSGKNVIALGGVTPEHISELKGAGFSGAAMLGYVWDNFSIDTLPDFINQINATMH